MAEIEKKGIDNVSCEGSFSNLEEMIKNKIRVADRKKRQDMARYAGIQKLRKRYKAYGLEYE